MTLRIVKRKVPLNQSVPEGAREALVLQEQVHLYTDPDGTTHYEWQDVPTVTIDENS